MARRHSCHRYRSRRALTLVELLIVISVGVLLLAAATPLLRTPTKTRKIREASREINAMVTRAKARASELDRPVGVMIRRAGSGDQALYSYQLSLIESPSPYFGDTTSSAAEITSYNVSTGQGAAKLIDSASATILAGQGSSIRFDFREPVFEITSLALSGSDCNITFAPPTWQPIVPPAPGYAVNGTPVAFQIYPSPRARTTGSVAQKLAIVSMGAPLELPNGIVIDLNVSGMGLFNNQFTPAAANDTTDVIVMFEPGGSVERVYWGNFVPGSSPPQVELTPSPATGTVYFLVGEIDQATADPFFRSEDLISNLCDAESLWVTIGHRTGKVTTTENASLDGVLPSPGSTITPAQAQLYLAAAREFARTSQNIGGQ